MTAISAELSDTLELEFDTRRNRWRLTEDETDWTFGEGEEIPVRLSGEVQMPGQRIGWIATLDSVTHRRHANGSEWWVAEYAVEEVEAW